LDPLPVSIEAENGINTVVVVRRIARAHPITLVRSNFLVIIFCMQLTQSSPHATARLLHALSDETRLDIVRRLGAGERCVCELTSALDAAQSRLSFHLKVLKEAGLVVDRRQGRWNYYTLVPEALDSIAESVLALRPDEDASTREVGCCR
jgi:ArsR family transcriptional regulator